MSSKLSSQNSLASQDQPIVSQTQNASKSLFKRAVEKTSTKIEEDNKNVAKRVAKLLANDEKHNQAISLQRILYILNLPSRVRNQDQISFSENYFETRFLYIQKIKDKLDKDLYDTLFYEMTCEQINKNVVVFEHGSSGRKMYFILSGEVGILLPTGEEEKMQSLIDKRTKPITQTTKFEELVRIYYSNFRLVATKNEGTFFGEIAIEQRIPRTATVVCKSDCVFAILTYDSYQRVLGAYQDKLTQTNLAFLQSIPTFKSWSKQGQFVFLHSCEEQQFESGSYLFRYGQSSSFVYLVIQGEVEVDFWVSQGQAIRESRFNKESAGELMNYFNTTEYKRNTLGVYGCGHIFGDYELGEQDFQGSSVRRKTQARAKTFTRVFRIQIGQYVDSFRLFSANKLDDLRLIHKQNLNFSKLYDKNIPSEYLKKQQVQTEEFQKINYGELGENYFLTLKANKEIQDIKITIHTLETQADKAEAYKKLEKLKDDEREIKELLIKKFSFIVPFREHPLNKETGVIKHTLNKVKKISHPSRPQTVQNSSLVPLTTFTPQCSIITIINGGQLKNDRRFFPKQESKLPDYKFKDVNEHRQLKLRNTLSIDYQYPNINLQKCLEVGQQQKSLFGLISQSSVKNIQTQTESYINHPIDKPFISPMHTKSTSQPDIGFSPSKSNPYNTEQSSKLRKFVQCESNLKGSYPIGVQTITPRENQITFFQPQQSQNLLKNENVSRKISIQYKFELARKQSTNKK